MFGIITAPLALLIRARAGVRGFFDASDAGATQGPGGHAADLVEVQAFACYFQLNNETH
jgi:hypothetical protein